MTTQDKIQSLRERIRKFILDIISFSRPLVKDDLNRILINQLLRSATSSRAGSPPSVTALISEAIQLTRIFSSLIQRRKLSSPVTDH